jgi:hypothetical protein
MSISAVTSRLISPRRLSFPHLAVAVLVALSLVSILVAISVSKAGPATGPSGGGPAAAGLTTRGYFRDPATHVLLRDQQPSPTLTPPGPGK